MVPTPIIGTSPLCRILGHTQPLNRFGVGVFGDGNRGFLLQWVGLGGFLQRCYLGRVFCNSPTGFFATVPACRGFLHRSHGGFLRRCRLAGGFLHQSHGGFLHQFSRPDKATLKQQKLQLENFGFSVFPHIPRRIKKLVLVAVVLLP